MATRAAASGWASRTPMPETRRAPGRGRRDECQRRGPGGRAALQRAADALAGAPFRSAVENRSREADRTFGAIDLGDHEPAAGRRAVAAARRRCGAASASRRCRCRSIPKAPISFGLKIGRRSCELVLVDFRGAIRQRAHETYAYPTPNHRSWILSRRSLPSLSTALCAAAAERIAGLGVAAPFQLWNW